MTLKDAGSSQRAISEFHIADLSQSCVSLTAQRGYCQVQGFLGLQGKKSEDPVLAILHRSGTLLLKVGFLRTMAQLACITKYSKSEREISHPCAGEWAKMHFLEEACMLIKLTDGMMIHQC